MILSKHTLINLPVYTQSNQHLGRVCDFEVDSITQTVVRYHVKSGGLIKELLQKELIIGKEQVVSITTDQMTVDDAILPIEDAKKQPIKEVAPAA